MSTKSSSPDYRVVVQEPLPPNRNELVSYDMDDNIIIITKYGTDRFVPHVIHCLVKSQAHVTCEMIYQVLC
jgi:hypothetical protein